MSTIQTAPAFERFLLSVFPGWAASRARARSVALRHYEAAAIGHRTSNWTRATGDANAVGGPALATLRALARDLVRNNPWAEEALRVLADHVVGEGIIAKPIGDTKALEKAYDAWKRWAESTDCDADGRLTFYGLQDLAMRTTAEAGEILVRRRRRRPADGLALPVQLQLLEPDFLDTAKDGLIGVEKGPIIQGVEFDAIGRRVAYWLFEQHPGSRQLGSLSSKRVAASEIIHMYRMRRPGQVRGPSWFAPIIARLRDFDEFEDAKLVQQKIAACFAAFETDLGDGPLGEQSAANSKVSTIQPGTILRLPPGKDVKFGTPPSAQDDGFSVRSLRGVAAGIGVTYEDMTGDYSQVNFSSGRMGWMKHWAHVRSWRANMMVPQFCNGAWAWAMDAALDLGLVETAPRAEWTAPAQPMIDPEKEGLAYKRRVRAGLMTPSESVREQGYDPDAFYEEFRKDLERLDALGIILDSDPRRVSDAGLTQLRAGAGNAEAKGEGTAASE